ncbi:hypothetical protein chiPu_0003593 [Chiloscyllium punctatum]|uniref:Uncharacterized protein n=1 Tax=Chiloscyllium punctatum TaxID=137246 RepID=A0A401S465_CHIPU|nr:hypothetical protein [Chiloscyllium punctatum]
MIHLDVPMPEKECERHEVKVLLKRVLRSIGQLPSHVPEFDPYSNDPWQVRHRALKHFQQAARKIIIQCRVNRRLILLQKLVKNLKRRYESKLSLKESSILSIGRTVQESEDRYYFEIGDIQPFMFPYYVSPDWKDELAADALGPVSVRPSEVVVDQVVPFFNLKVYQRYKQMEYNPYSTQYVSSSYLPLTLSRPLRSGAEDELYLILPTKKTDTGTEASMDELHEKHHHVENKEKHITTKTSILFLKPPQGLIKQPDYHPLHVFVIWMMIIQDLSPNPLTVMLLNKQEIIKGVMTWKKFPSAALLSLSNSDFLTSTWVPRWSDVFPSDMLPVNAPTQLDRLPDEDRENIAMESSEEVDLTPEMLEAEFTMIESPLQLPESPKDETAKDDGEPLKANLSQTSFTDEIVTREKREEQLNQWLESNNNRLGSSIQLRIEQLRELCINKHLLLK